MAWSHINCNILDKDGTKYPASKELMVETFDDSGNRERACGHMDIDGRLVFDIPDEMPCGQGLNYVLIAPDCRPLTGRAVTPDTSPGDVELPYTIQLVEGPNPFD